MPEELIAFFSICPSNILIDMGGIALKCGALCSVLAEGDAMLAAEYAVADFGPWRLESLQPLAAP